MQHLKACICIPCLLFGGTEIQTLNLVKALITNGYIVTTICYFEYSDQMVDLYKNAGSEIICLSKNGKRINGLKSIVFLFQNFKKIFTNYKPNIIHVQYMAPGAIPIILLKLLGYKNIIATVHTAGDIYRNLNIVHFIQRHCVRVFTCITKTAEENFFGSSNLYSEKTILKHRNHFTIYNSLPSYIPITSITRNAYNKQITLGVVSRLEEIKGMDFVIPAFRKIKNRYNNVNLLIVGDGSYKSQMEKQVIEFKLTENVKFVGRQSPEKLKDYYDLIDILLIPSRSEGFGLTAIEGMARGCVVLASNTGGLAEVVENGKVGILHKNGDINDIANKACELINNQEYLKNMSELAKEYVSKFSFNTYSNLFNDLYKKLI